MATVATRQNESSSYEKQERTHLTPTGLLMEGDYTQNAKLAGIIASCARGIVLTLAFGEDADGCSKTGRGCRNFCPGRYGRNRLFK
jgi:hypothetical protein